MRLSVIFSWLLLTLVVMSSGFAQTDSGGVIGVEKLNDAVQKWQRMMTNAEPGFTWFDGQVEIAFPSHGCFASCEDTARSTIIWGASVGSESRERALAVARESLQVNARKGDKICSKNPSVRCMSSSDPIKPVPRP